MIVGYCQCPSPDTALVEGLLVCSRCGERVRDPQEQARDASLAALLRTLASIDRRLAGTANGNESHPGPVSADSNGQPAFSIPLPPELLEAIAQRAAGIVLEQARPQEEDGWLRGADAIAGYIGAKRDRVYALRSAGRIPVENEGGLVAKRSELDAWIRAGGGKRP